MEKYDGIRVLWNGSKLQTQDKKVIQVPSNVTFPPITFEAELWYVVSSVHLTFRCGYNGLEKAIDIVNSKTPNWNNVQLIAFDTLSQTTKSYTERLQILKDSILYQVEE
jgi:hypothetical protein